MVERARCLPAAGTLHHPASWWLQPALCADTDGVLLQARLESIEVKRELLEHRIRIETDKKDGIRSQKRRLIASLASEIKRIETLRFERTQMVAALRADHELLVMIGSQRAEQGYASPGSKETEALLETKIAQTEARIRTLEGKEAAMLRDLNNPPKKATQQPAAVDPSVLKLVKTHEGERDAFAKKIAAMRTSSLRSYLPIVLSVGPPPRPYTSHLSNPQSLRSYLPITLSGVCAFHLLSVHAADFHWLLRFLKRVGRFRL